MEYPAHSERYVELYQRISELKVNFLPSISPLGEYSTSEVDRIRAFRVLCHAEIEQFVEDLAQSLGAVLEREMANHRYGNHFSRCFATTTLKKLSHQIANNHGISEAHLLTLFGLFGFQESDFDDIDPQLLKRMNTFGRNRGDVAHKSANRMTIILNPVRESTFVDEILGYLLQIDIKIQQRRLRGIL